MICVMNDVGYTGRLFSRRCAVANCITLVVTYYCAMWYNPTHINAVNCDVIEEEQETSGVWSVSGVVAQFLMCLSTSCRRFTTPIRDLGSAVRLISQVQKGSVFPISITRICVSAHDP